ncbi:hypothetical protein [Ferrovum myxofaciens]|jgi:flagellar basal body-associated protein FliL|uniref:Uncharacterized protein n=2 Tax=root TaxID=1 RepID=A0A8F3IFP4_9PROT|nr:hypothetical protein [Ferrovum myxofaciens]MBW8028484.1 hypothetical protein [Ferrovum sp.]KXW58135.1 hypothetical protein FEMY_13110 [Ferrovum myxofaciens]MBU6994491.1 hypothetical protein [Ferrovum myxofaciens]NDU90255.1 hypothetical protein [Ferrovum sp.]QKE38363.1 MAG: hypothetical protein HO273_06165 [Ferrovum myxofaciens]
MKTGKLMWLIISVLLLVGMGVVSLTLEKVHQQKEQRQQDALLMSMAPYQTDIDETLREMEDDSGH